MLFWSLACVIAVDQDLVIDEPVDRIWADLAAGDLEIVAGEGPVRIDARFGGVNGAPIGHDVVDGELLVRFDCALCGGTLTITTPPSTELDLTVWAGDLTVSDMDGLLFADVKGGEAQIRRHGAGPVTATVGVGDLKALFDEVPTAVTVDMDVGATELRVPSGPYDVEVTGQGALDIVNIEVDAQSPHALTVHSGVGAVALIGI